MQLFPEQTVVSQTCSCFFNEINNSTVSCVIVLPALDAAPVDAVGGAGGAEPAAVRRTGRPIRGHHHLPRGRSAGSHTLSRARRRISLLQTPGTGSRNNTHNNKQTHLLYTVYTVMYNVHYVNNHNNTI